METAILVDWELYSQNTYTQDFVIAREGQARLIMLVPYPSTHDFDIEDSDIEWDAVIRNSGGKENVVFKAAALDVIQNASSMLPVIALDGDILINKMYRSGGVLVTTGDM